MQPLLIHSALRESTLVCGDQDGHIVLTHLSREEGDREGSLHCKLQLKQKQTVPALPWDPPPINYGWTLEESPGESGYWGEFLQPHSLPRGLEVWE